MYTIVGLGNPGEAYAETRHNTGRMALEALSKKEIDGIKLISLDTFMNKSGSGVAKVIKSKKAAEKLVIIYDDLDLPLGTMKISYNRGSGGHKGIESIIRALKTEAFIRVRIGISPVTPSGKIKKPLGEKNVERHILGKFSPKEALIFKKVLKRVVEAVETLSAEGLQTAMTQFNS
ncbi:aminoacyl-tRNA hydrolase [Candidatus Parcubacteria bacterium]|nr:aminoacyl-tRNA hydrolase [Candidatus Parcubacteria bacterium]